MTLAEWRAALEARGYGKKKEEIGYIILYYIILYYIILYYIILCICLQ